MNISKKGARNVSRKRGQCKVPKIIRRFYECSTNLIWTGNISLDFQLHGRRNVGCALGMDFSLAWQRENGVLDAYPTKKRTFEKCNIMQHFATFTPPPPIALATPDAARDDAGETYQREDSCVINLAVLFTLALSAQCLPGSAIGRSRSGRCRPLRRLAWRLRADPRLRATRSLCFHGRCLANLAVFFTSAFRRW